jgi:putative membrane-bound dehydrogenase-like protein
MRTSIQVIALLCLTCLPVAAFADASNVITTSGGMIRVPEGFTIERAAASPIVQHPMMAGFDGQGRLFIAASSGKNLRTADLEKELPNFIRMIEDTDGDGVFDKSTIFADKMTLPMGALWFRGALYVAAPPSIWRLEDTDNDGVADKREDLVGKFGYSGNAASIHGPFLSPSGRLFWCDGRHGHEFRDADGNVISQKRGSGIFTMRPDGSDARMFCGGGMDNPVEVDFLATGEIVGPVNIFYTRPRVDTLVHWQEGGVYPHQEVSIAEFKRTGDLLPSMTNFGHVAVSGMCRSRSAALGEDYQDNLFTTIFNTGKVMRSTVQRHGGTFRTREEEFLVSDDPDLHPTDILEDADGSLLLIDTGGWFRIGCPTSQIAKPEIHGAIYRIRRTGAKPVDDPRGLKIAFDSLNLQQLLALLSDERQAVCEKAVEALALRVLPSDDQAVFKVSNFLSWPDSTPQTARIHAIHALSRYPSRFSTHEILRQTVGTGVGIPLQIAAANVLAEMGRGDVPLDLELFGGLLATIKSTKSLALKRTAARAVGSVLDSVGRQSYDDARDRSHVDSAVPVLMDTLVAGYSDSASPPIDRPTEHAILFALIRIGFGPGVVPYLSHENPRVRRAALIALDQMDYSELNRDVVVSLLDTENSELKSATLDVISRREGWADETRSLMQEWLLQSKLPQRQADLARTFLSGQAAGESFQTLIAELLGSQKSPPASRLLLLEVMQDSGLAKFPEAWKPGVQSALESQETGARRLAVAVINTFALSDFDESLLQLGRDAETPTALRIETLATTAQRRSEVSDAESVFLARQLDAEVPPLTRVGAARALAMLPASHDQQMSLAQHVRSVGPLTIGILLGAFRGELDADVSGALLTSLRTNKAAAGLRPSDLTSVIENSPENLADGWLAFADSLSSGSNETALMQRLNSLTAGDVNSGRAVFLSKTAACASCHTVAGQGGRIGPDLTKIGAIRNQRDLLEAMMFPSASFARGYRSHTVVTTSGRVHSGLITRETTDFITMRKTDLTEVRVRRDDVEILREADKSVMPEGMLLKLSEKDLSDLLAYLQSLK